MRTGAPRSGLFARLTLGGDYASVVTKSDMLPDDITMSGLGIGLSGDIGYAPSGLFALHLRAMIISIFAPTIELADMAGQSDDVSLSSITLGFGGTVYPVPFFYATALVGISRWTLEIPYADGRATANSDFGPWVNAEIGFEAPLSGGLRLGIGARLNHASMDGGDGSELSSTGYGVFASFTVIEP